MTTILDLGDDGSDLLAPNADDDALLRTGEYGWLDEQARMTDTAHLDDADDPFEVDERELRNGWDDDDRDE